MADPWSKSEVEAAVADYFVMYEAERRGESFNKAEHNRELRKRLSGRSKTSVEIKHQNISAAMVDHGLPYLPGYVPMKNYQGLVFDVVGEMIWARRDLVAIVAREVAAPPPSTTIANGIPKKVSPPARKPNKYPVGTKERRIGRLGVDYLAREAGNRKLGLAGEERALSYEIERLVQARRERLAAKVVHVSKKEGDGLGFDILSFELTGEERFIEVKTTAYGIGIPFYVSRGEVEFSKRNAEQFQLYRFFDFNKEASFFALAGSLERSCSLDAVQFKASAS
jgi:hypothetical protein